MHTYSDAFYLAKNKLLSLYDENEAAAISHELLLHITGANKMQRLMLKEKEFSLEQQSLFDQSLDQLLTGKPIQYITGLAWFKGNEYIVNEHVLIPRPETEELVDWIITDQKQDNRKDTLHILDIGTGSGCIAISLKLAFPDATVTSCDISPNALRIANQNSKKLDADIRFIQMNFLDTMEQNKLGKFNVIVSNPPYIPISEKEKLHTNVRDFEPGLALFVPNDDPLIFYKAIARFCKGHLHESGSIYCEMEASYTSDCHNLFLESGYKTVEIRKDMHGNERMLKANLNE